MASERQTVKSQLNEYLAQRAPGEITEPEWLLIRQRFSGTSESYLRRLLRESGEQLAPVVNGVRQSNFAELEDSLRDLEIEYTSALERRDRERLKQCRRLVIEAKNHARLAAVRSKDAAKKGEKHEMVRWMLVWLENPAAFPPWARLRRRAALSAS